MSQTDPRCTEPIVVVGVDERPAARNALEWALHHLPAEATVRPLITWTSPFPATPMPAPGAPPALPPDAWLVHAEERGACALADLDDPRLGELETVRGRRGSALADAAAGADAVIIGARADRRPALLGTTGSRLAKATKVPLVVVPEVVAPATPIRTVVVGIDGSAHAQAALDWTLDRVGPDTEVVAVTTWQRPSVALDVAPDIDDALQAAAARTLDGAIERLDPRHDPTRVTCRVLHGDARLALGADDPDVIVVGARGRRGIPHAVLGSVATSLVTSPTTVTVVVP